MMAGCMPAQGPQATLAVNPAEVNVSELNGYDTAALAPSELPAEGPAVETRPAVLALARGTVSIGETIDPMAENEVSAAKPEMLQAMLEPQAQQLMPELEPEKTVAFAKPAKAVPPPTASAIA